MVRNRTRCLASATKKLQKVQLLLVRFQVHRHHLVSCWGASSDKSPSCMHITVDCICYWPKKTQLQLEKVAPSNCQQPLTIWFGTAHLSLATCGSQSGVSSHVSPVYRLDDCMLYELVLISQLDNCLIVWWRDEIFATTGIRVEIVMWLWIRCYLESSPMIMLLSWHSDYHTAII